jgi:hypothetical protein
MWTTFKTLIQVWKWWHSLKLIDFNTPPSKLTIPNDSISRRQVIKSNISSPPFEGDLKNEIPTPFQNASFFLLFFMNSILISNPCRFLRTMWGIKI